MKDRVNRQGQILHWSSANTYTVGRPDQCEYSGCNKTKAAHSPRCFQHSR